MVFFSEIQRDGRFFLEFWGGVRQGMAISWPGHIDDPGGIRNQLHHMIDIVPTILDAAKIQAPSYVDAIKQNALHVQECQCEGPYHSSIQYFRNGGRARYLQGRMDRELRLRETDNRKRAASSWPCAPWETKPVKQWVLAGTP